jgi:U3 small nucleolar RNA-associated protein 5
MATLPPPPPQQLAAFGPTASCEYFAFVTNDGRLRLWETSTNTLKQEYTENDHFSIRYTCMAWKAPAGGKGQGKKRRKTSSLGNILLGTSNGDVVVWDLEVGQVLHRISAYAKKPVSSIAVAEEVIYTASSGDSKVKRFNVHTGDKIDDVEVNASKGLERVAVDAAGSSFAAGNVSVQLWDASSNAKVAHFGGHARAMNGLRFSADGKYLLSTAKHDRFPALWDVAAAAGGDSEDARQTFTMEAPPLCSDISCEGDGRYHLLAVSENGRLNVWDWESSPTESPEKKSKKKKKKKKKSKRESLAVPALPSNGSTDDELARIFSARFCSEADGAIFVAHGSLAGPIFERVSYLDDGNNVVADIVVKSAGVATDASLLMGQGAASAGASASRRAHVAGTAENGIVSWPTDATANGGGDAGSEDDDDDATLAERVDALTKQLEVNSESDGEENEKQSSAMRTAAARAAEIASTVEDDSVLGSGRTPRARSLVKILEQALKVSDDALLEHCLSTSDVHIIRETVQGLSALCVTQFLTRVISKFEARPARAATLCLWIKTIVETHAGYLTSSQDAVAALGNLHSTVDTRLGVFKRLLKLSGRLDLILSQINMLQTNRTVSSSDAGGVGGKRARTVFKDTGVDEEDSDGDDASSDDDGEGVRPGSPGESSSDSSSSEDDEEEE